MYLCRLLLLLESKYISSSSELLSNNSMFVGQLYEYKLLVQIKF